MPKQTKKFKRRLLANKGLAVSWNTADRLVFITLRGGVTMGFTWQDAMQIADQLLMGAEAVETASEDEADDDFDPELDQRLRDQLNSEVSAAMDALGPTEFQPKNRSASQGPAAPPSSSVPLGGTARLAEELGSARETLAEILGQAGDCRPETVGSHHAPRDERDARPTQITQAFEGPVAGFSSPPRLGADVLIRGLCEHPTDPGKILVNGVAISLGHARQYEVALRFLIESQRAKAVGRDLQATVATPEPPAEIPTLRAD